MDSNWLNELKPGDPVFVSGTYGEEATESKVTRITKSAIFVGKHSRFNKKGQIVPRDTWHSVCLLPVTAELVAAEQLQRKRWRILKWRAEVMISELPEATCDALLAIINPKEEAKPC